MTTHTFIDGRQRIKCMLCGLEAWSNSGEDFKFAYMRDLAEYSTNRPSASEQPVLGVKFGGFIVEYFRHTPAGIAALKAKYPLWDGKFKRAGSDEGESPIKGREPATKENEEGITVVFQDDLLYKKPDLKGDLQ